MNNMEKLENIGFIKVGAWIRDSNLNHTITKHLDERSLLYSFISDSEVIYIGKTADTLRNRMNGYRNAGKSQRTNTRVKEQILDLLQNKKEVDIYILIDNANLTFMSYNISLAAGLEDSLISDIQPKLNFRGNNSIRKQEAPPECINLIDENLLRAVITAKTVEIKLGQEYWNKGFFNFSKKERDYLPTEPTNIRMVLGDGAEFIIEGRFLFSTKDGQPRVTANRSLRAWFQANKKIGDKIKVDIIEPALFKIY